MNRRLRLRRPDDFARLRREGHSVRHPLLVVSFAPNGRPHNRYGFITAKRLGNAVTRNRVRRLMREAVRSLHPRIIPGNDIVIIARAESVGQPYQAILNAIEALCARAALMNDEKEDRKQS